MKNRVYHNFDPQQRSSKSTVLMEHATRHAATNPNSKVIIIAPIGDNSMRVELENGSHITVAGTTSFPKKWMEPSKS